MDQVLVIDDEPIIRELLTDFLMSKGYEVNTAENGKKGIDLINNHPPKLIILDLDMPGMNGLAFLEALTPRIGTPYSIIVLTGHGTDEAVKNCFSLGIQSFLRKPVNLFELEGQISRNIELINYAEKIKAYTLQLKREISEKEKALNLLKTTFEGMAEGVIAFDDGFLIQMISDKACSILGLDEDHAIGRSAASILGIEVAGPGSTFMEAVRYKHEVTSEHSRLLSPAGTVIQASVVIKPIKNSTADISWLMFIRDRREEERQSRENSGGVFFGKMIGSDDKMKEIFKLVDNVASSNASILIQGESGTGKELVAQELHERSRRAQQPFQVVNCAAIPANLLESEFFGHEKGAFTGAHKKRMGRFELANTGTLFLDEVADIPFELQVKLLRVLQEQKFERVGGNRSISVDVRIISATNKNLSQMVTEKSFRDDLFYRLDVVSITLPSLRERITDLPLLIPHFIEVLNEKENRKVKSFSAAAMQMLFAYHWPGNVRELMNVIEYAVAVSNGTILKPEHLPEKILSPLHPVEDSDFEPLSEKHTIQQALKDSSFKKGKAAALLGVSYSTLYRKMLKYKL